MAVLDQLASLSHIGVSSVMGSLHGPLSEELRVVDREIGGVLIGQDSHLQLLLVASLFLLAIREVCLSTQLLA